jgi:ADP-heptose:LPS heptosyltransferase
VTQLKSSVAAPETILVLPFADGIGDFVNMQPLLAAVSRRFPGAQISVAASSYANQLISASNPVKIVTPSWFNKEPGPVAQTLRHFIPQTVLARFAGPVLKRELGGDIDLVINTIWLWEKRMDFPRYWTPQIPARPGAVHTLDCIADALEEELNIVIPQSERYPRLEVHSYARTWAENYIEQHNLGDRRIVALVPESNMLIKKWQVAGWAYLNDRLHERGYEPIFFAPEDSAQITRIRRLAKCPVTVVSATLDNVAGLLQKSSLAIGVDTGLLHIASAVGTRWLGLFGPTNPEVTGPYDRRIGRGLVAPYLRTDACRTCWKSFKYEDDLCHALPDNSCTEFLDKAIVLNAALDMLPGKYAL